MEVCLPETWKTPDGLLTKRELMALQRTLSNCEQQVRCTTKRLYQSTMLYGLVTTKRKLMALQCEPVNCAK